MTAQYRIVHFVSDPFLGGRTPIGAMVQDQNGVAFIPAPIPDPTCLGGVAASASLRISLRMLEELLPFETVPPLLGDGIAFASPHRIPPGVKDPRSWVETLFTLTRDASPVDHGSKHGPQRGTLGFRHLETHRVSAYVKKDFRPGTSSPALRRWGDFRPITHFVSGERSLMLMEPIVPKMNDALREEIRDVSATVQSYHAAIVADQKDNFDFDVFLVVYVLPGIVPSMVGEVKDRLRDHATVLDVGQSQENSHLIDSIRQLGESGRLAAEKNSLFMFHRS